MRVKGNCYFYDYYCHYVLCGERYDKGGSSEMGK